MFEITRRFFATWRFPAAAVSALVTYVSILTTVLLLPGAPGSFAEDFKIWCFGYDPATGGVEWAYVWMFLLQPLILAGLIAAVWRGSLRAGAAIARGGLAIYAGSGAAVALALGLGLVTMTGPASDAAAADASFPADDLRLAHPAAMFELTDQTGATVSLEDLEGRVVLLTAVYARCGHTCPTTIAQVKRAAASLSDAERTDLTVVLLTLDPAHDTPEIMAGLAVTHELSSPSFRLLSGAAQDVNAVLDDYEFARRTIDEDAIEHSNVAVLIDRRGRVAYRLPLVEQRETWLADALQVLVREPAAP